MGVRTVSSFSFRGFGFGPELGFVFREGMGGMGGGGEGVYAAVGLIAGVTVAFRKLVALAFVRVLSAVRVGASDG